MNWIQSLRHRYSLNVFRARAKKVTFPHQFIDFDRAESIGFIVNIGQFNADDLVFFTKYITRLEDKNKRVVVVELNFQRKSEPMFKDSVKSIFINPGQVNWLYYPSVQRLKEINEAKLDILVNLDTTENMTSRYVCGLSNAKTRVGLHEPGYEDFYELLLQLPTDTKLNKVLENFEHFSKMLEK